VTVPSKKRTHRCEAAIAALLTHPTVETAARAAGVGEKTLRRWLQDSDFATRYGAARREVLELAVGVLQNATADAVEALRRNTDASRPPGVQVRAAAALLTLAFKGIETVELMAKVDDLERRLGAQEPQL
jgi:hypothetical protein